MRIRGVPICNSGDRYLVRAEPEGEFARKVFDQYAEKSLDRAEQGAMKHHRPLVACVGLSTNSSSNFCGSDMSSCTVPHCQYLPSGVADVDVDFRSVKSAVPLVDPIGMAPIVKSPF